MYNNAHEGSFNQLCYLRELCELGENLKLEMSQNGLMVENNNSLNLNGLDVPKWGILNISDQILLNNKYFLAVINPSCSYFYHLQKLDPKMSWIALIYTSWKCSVLTSQETSWRLHYFKVTLCLQLSTNLRYLWLHMLRAFHVFLIIWMWSFHSASQILFCNNSQQTLENVVVQHILENAYSSSLLGVTCMQRTLDKLFE